jgi:hypothetical protein
MAVQLTSLLQHADNVGTGPQADNKPIFINTRGDISGKSGLGFFQRHFSSSAGKAENRASLDAFHAALTGNERYRGQLENRDGEIARFFRTKHEQGTPLTAREVRQVKTALDMENAAKVGREFAGRGVIPAEDAMSFAWFCAGKGLSVGSPEETKDALKAYLSSRLEEKARGALGSAGVKPENMDAAMQVLKRSDAWTSALDGAFEGDLSELTGDGIMDKFGGALKEAAELLSDMDVKYNMGGTFLRDTAESPEGMGRFNGALEAARTGILRTGEAAGFFAACVAENVDPSSPELLGGALCKYCADLDSEDIFAEMAADNELPAEAGKALAHNPEFRAAVDAALAEAFPPPEIPTRREIDKVIAETAAVFLVDKNDDIRSVLAMAGKNVAFSSAPGDVGTLDKKSICGMLNPLLSGRVLLDHLLDPAKGSDRELAGRLADFRQAVSSCLHTGKGEVDRPEADEIEMTRKAMALLLAARGADENTPGTLLEQVNKDFPQLGRGLNAMNVGVTRGTLQCDDPTIAATGINHALNAMRMVAEFAYQAASPEQKETLGISANGEEFSKSLEFNPDGGVAPLDEIHQSARAFGASLGVRIAQTSYDETNQLAASEVSAFTGPTEHPVATPLLIDRATEIAAEIGLDPFDSADLDPVAVGGRIASAVQEKSGELLSPGEARRVSDQAVREYLLELKSAVDYIKALPTQPTGVKGELVVSQEEKEHLLKFIPGTSVRSPKMIKTVMVQSRELVRTHVPKLLTPGFTVDDMANRLTSITHAYKYMMRLTGLPAGAFRAVLAMGLESLRLEPDQERALYNLLSGDQSRQLGNGCLALAEQCREHAVPDAEMHSADLRLVATGADDLRMILGRKLGEEVKEDPDYYSSNSVHARDIPAGMREAAEQLLNIRFNVFSGDLALSMLVPKPTQEEWDALLPILQTVGTSISHHMDNETVSKMVAANAPELLAALQANGGRPLSPAQIWETVIGGPAPEGLNEDNLGVRMYEGAVSRLYQRLHAMNPDREFDEPTQTLLRAALVQGIPFKSLYDAYKPQGSLSIQDARFSSFTLSSPIDTLDNAYGLPRDWPRRKSSPSGVPSRMTITDGDGNGVIMHHHAVPDDENVPDNPTYVEIIDRCRGICKNHELQCRAVVNCLSQASTVMMRMLSEKFAGYGRLDEHSHMDSTVSPLDNGDVVVELSNGPDDRPFGGHMRILVTPEGETTITDCSVQLRG